MADVPVDERGIPTEMDESGSSALHCPAKPCDLCTGNSAHTSKGPARPSWEWCQEMNTCGATVDWDKIYGGR